MEIKMKRFAILFTVFAVFFLVSCGGSSKDEDKTDTGDTTVDTGDTQTDPTDTGDSGDTDTAEPTKPSDPTTEPTDDPTDIEGTTWEAKYKRADAHADAVSANIVMANTRLGLNIFKKLALGNHDGAAGP